MRQLRSALDQHSGEPWHTGVDDMWCHVRPPARRGRDQGWKLHLSASVDSAPEVLRRVLPILLSAGCPFKFASTIDRLELLNSAHYPRAGAGKFVTVYPLDDDQFRWLAERLSVATADLAGPRILSDRPYRPGGLVYYRYGGFLRIEELSNDAEIVLVVRDPDGHTVPDRREIYAAPPPWAPAPFAASAAPATGPAAGAVLLDDRFLVREAIRHSNRGGVYRATDTRTDATVIVKQARRHVRGNAGGTATDALRHEATVLAELAVLGLAPAALALFEQDGDLFLAQELVDGVPLRLWVRQQGYVIGPTTPDEPGVAWPAVARTLAGLADLLARAHGAGWIIRDLSPSNVMVTPSGELRLVDLEFAARAGDRPVAGGTPGYVAPEQAAGAPAAPANDLYALGALAFLLATGVDPTFAPDTGNGRRPAARMAAWLRMLAPCAESARRVLPAVVGLTDREPMRRWSIQRIRRFLAAPHAPTAPADASRVPSLERLDRLIADGVEQLCHCFDPTSDERLWPVSCTVGSVDPCNAQHGAAGVLATLARAARHGYREQVHALLPDAVDWVVRRMSRLPQVLPGLYFGRSGTAWALAEVAAELADPAGFERAVDLAATVPLRWPNPDVAHGMSGAGLTQLRFWLTTGQPRFAERLETVADAVTAAVERRGAQLRWPIPSDFDSRLKGLSHYGFAHGVAGAGYFLLVAGQALGRDDLLSLADQAGHTVAAAAVRADGGALWPTDTESPNDAVEHWCSGSAGVGTFLLRLWRATGTTYYRELAEAAARAAWRRRWYASTVACHGLAGIGEFLIDLAEVVDGPYRLWAEEVGALVYARSAIRHGRRVPPDETGIGFGTEFGGGLAGTLSFLLRLRHGGPRPWAVDVLPGQAPVTGLWKRPAAQRQPA